MSDWVIWLVSAIAVLILEISIGTFYLLMVSIGLLAGAIAALAGAQGAIQFIAAAFVGGTATVFLHKRRRKKENASSSSDPNVNLDIGETLNVPAWVEDGSGHYIARTNYRGSLWDVEFSGSGEPGPGNYKIHEIRGSRLLVSRY